ncbi:hypothetical protein RJ55_01032 [Drechmeria coniospora]|nr:hypothetical protein RJ55_01032 [Drechmeria coniospora]
MTTAIRWLRKMRGQGEDRRKVKVGVVVGETEGSLRRRQGIKRGTFCTGTRTPPAVSRKTETGRRRPRFARFLSVRRQSSEWLTPRLRGASAAPDGPPLAIPSHAADVQRLAVHGG